MDSDVENNDVTSSTTFIQMRRPPQNRYDRAPRPHSIGASIISNPKLVKGWTYYDPNPRNMQKYFSSVNLPPGPNNPTEESIKNSSYNDSGGCVSPRRTQFQQQEVNNEIDPMMGVEIKPCIAEEDDVGRCNSFLGIFLILFASTCIGLSSVLAKCLVIDYYHPYSVTVWTFQGIFLPSLIVYLISCVFKATRSQTKEELRIDYIVQRESSSCRKVSIRGVLIIFSGLFGSIGLLLKIYSLKYISTPDSATIIFTYPVFVIITSWICRRARVRFIPILIALVLVLGASVTTRPPILTGDKGFDRDNLIGCSMAAGCMLTIVFTEMIIRYLDNVHYALINFIFGLMGTAGGLLLCESLHDGFELPVNTYDYYQAGAIAGLTFVGHSLITKTLKYEEYRNFAFLRLWEIPMSFLFEFFLLERYPDWRSLIAAALVIFGVFLLSLINWLKVQPRSKKLRKSCRFLLL